MVFAGFVNANRTLFVNLARNWMQSGATSFSIWENGQQLDSWGQGYAHPDDESLITEIRKNGHVIGEIKLTCQSSLFVTDRLQMDADLISGLIARENDLNLMASELLDTRDQLIALYNLTQKKWTSLDLDSTLNSLTRAAASLTRSQAAFMAVQLNDVPLQFAASPAGSFDWASVSNNIETLKEKKSQYLIVEEAQQSDTNQNLQVVMLSFQVRGAGTAVAGIRTNVRESSLSPVIKLLRAVAAYTGSRIENLLMVQESVELAKLHKEMELAHNVQSSLLPEILPVVPGLKIWAVSQPASFVGGDFYDIVAEPGRPLTFSVADISGKGFPASIPMAMTRILIRCHVYEFSSISPNFILTRINSQLFFDFNRLGIFATIFVCQYDPQMNSITYTNAGHSPVIYCPANNDPCLLAADGIPLGLLSDSTYADNQLCFKPGDVLVIGTDAFYEQFNSQEQIFSLERLMQQVKQLAHLEPEQIGKGLLETMEHFRGEKAQDDDQTLIVIKSSM
jgi:phosphoserine phosphatase RsbU/P